MSEPLELAEGLSAKEDPAKLVLRGQPRPVVRFRRGLIVGVSGAIACTLAALSWLALQPSGVRKIALASAVEPVPSGAAPDVLAGAPKSYADVPRLGPPLPGDLGRAILEHQRGLARGREGRFGIGADEEAAAQSQRERIAAAAASAHSSPVLVQLGQSEGQRSIAGARSGLAPASASPEAAGDFTPASAGPQQKVAFARITPGEISLQTLHAATSPFTLAAGTIIPASLITGINSDLPGMVIAQVTENVRDSATGTMILVPQGARLIGRYDSVVAYGQRRALVLWNRILFPDGASINLDNMPAADVSGYAGLRDGVDSHTWQLLKGIGLSTLLGVGTQLSLGSSGSDLIRAIRESVQQGASTTGAQITGRNLDIQPTIRIRPGWPVRAILNKDLELHPYARRDAGTTNGGMFPLASI